MRPWSPGLRLAPAPLVPSRAFVRPPLPRDALPGNLLLICPEHNVFLRASFEATLMFHLLLLFVENVGLLTKANASFMLLYPGALKDREILKYLCSLFYFSKTTVPPVLRSPPYLQSLLIVPHQTPCWPLHKTKPHREPTLR